ncbi:hypothetical protein [Candidatus Soleaferrea massiliensis]|uniref:hypothetical protein n=1 Tax=Candidatus Soleaferrea massiliensis TaxID=1470354 RepID=UPI0012E0952F|nr:hypothetical protein [Candidatus Soleaferrea massiliensis]
MKAWKTSIEQMSNAHTAPKEDFREILHSNLLKLHVIGAEENPDFESVPIPKAAKSISRLSKKSNRYQTI